MAGNEEHACEKPAVSTNAFNQGSREKKVPAPIGQQTPASGRGRVAKGDRPMVAGTFFGPLNFSPLGPRFLPRLKSRGSIEATVLAQRPVASCVPVRRAVGSLASNRR